MTPIAKLLLGGPLDRTVLAANERSTYMIVDKPLQQYSSFFLRLIAATVVATAGVAADSAATIIGAMIIAPLMSPMLGSALAIVLCRPRATMRALGLVAVGTAVVIATSMGITAILPVAVDLQTNTQVLARISPRLVDLVIALAASFIAALASMRRDIPDALPGVAISASIVPPLCVSGAALYEGAPEAALGAFFLFITNFVAIQVMGSIVYLLMGLGSRKYSTNETRTRRAWYAAIAVTAIAVTVLLSNSTLAGARAARLERLAQDTAIAWLDDANYRIVQLDIVDDNLYLVLAGTGSSPALDELNEALLDAGADFNSVSLSVIPEVRVENG